MTEVDGCETDEYRAFEVNALGPKYLAENVTRQEGTLLHVSTDRYLSRYFKKIG